MSFAVKRIDTGEYLDEEGYWTAYTPCLCNTREEAEVDLTAYRDKTLGLEIVELTEKPAPVVVSEAEAEMLKTAKDPTFRPSSVITSYSNDHHGWDLTNDLEDRLMRAYVNGYTVAKEKRYNVKVPHVPLYYWKKPDGSVGIDDLTVATADDDTDDFDFTEAEIEQYDLQDCEKEEVTDDEQ